MHTLTLRLYLMLVVVSGFLSKDSEPVGLGIISPQNCIVAFQRLDTLNERALFRDIDLAPRHRLRRQAPKLQISLEVSHFLVQLVDRRPLPI